VPRKVIQLRDGSLIGKFSLQGRLQILETPDAVRTAMNPPPPANRMSTTNQFLIRRSKERRATAGSAPLTFVASVSSASAMYNLLLFPSKRSGTFRERQITGKMALRDDWAPATGELRHCFQAVQAFVWDRGARTFL
jgi:hypothetical protein